MISFLFLSLLIVAGWAVPVPEVQETPAAFGSPFASGDFFREFGIADHPLNRLDEFKFSGAPVGLQRCVLEKNGFNTTKGCAFYVRTASFMLENLAPYVQEVDAVVVPPLGRKRTQRSVQLVFNRELKVVVLLSGGGMSKMKDFHVAGLSGYANPQVVRRGGSKLSAGNERLPQKALALEKNVGSGAFVLPHPSTINVGGWVPSTITVLLTDSERQQLPFPGLPKKEEVERVLGAAMVMEQPLPNRKCPQWLHDINVVLNKNRRRAEPKYWATFHPQVDYMYYCFYGHEHGSDPSPFLPAYGKTAFHTKSARSVSGRQEETLNGFKTSAMLVDDDDRSRAVIITAHMHLSNGMRVFMRHHTVMITIFDREEDEWAMTLDLQYKADFGPGMLTWRNGTHVALNAAQEEIAREVSIGKSFKARRRFMVVGDELARFRTREYEFWDTFIPSCGSGTMRFDVRNPSTGVRTRQGDIGFMGGNGINRVFSIITDELSIARDQCNLPNGGAATRSVDGIFYTDSYFTRFEEGPKDFALRQFIRDDFVPLRLKREMYFPQDVFTTRLDRKDVGVVAESVEGGIDPSIN